MDIEGSGGLGSRSDVACGDGSHRQMARVITVDNGRNSQEATDTITVGHEKIFIFFQTWSVSIYNPMVVKLVWQ